MKLNIQTNDFIYLDSPYSISTATYNEVSKWNNNDDYKLLKICQKLNEHNINFGMNNVLLNKGIKNHKLINFYISNNLNIYTPNNFKYHACRKENSRQLKVYTQLYTKK